MVRRLLYFDYILSVRILEVIGESARCGFFFKLLFLYCRSMFFLFVLFCFFVKIVVTV